MHYSDERLGTLFSMLTGAAEREDGDPGNDRKKLKKGETDPACVRARDLFPPPEVLTRCARLGGFPTETLLSFSAPLAIPPPSCWCARYSQSTRLTRASEGARQDCGFGAWF